MDDLGAKIVAFTGFQSSQVEFISSLTGKVPEIDNLYKKILYVAVLDTLSKSVYPTKGNRDRLVSLLFRFTDWSEAQRISLPHLVRLLEMVPDPAFEKLRLFAHEQLDAWTLGRVISLDSDPTLDEIKNLWPTEKEHRIPLKDVSLESLQHAHLFYTYRNSIVHELRHPGFPSEFRKEGLPYYVGRIRDTSSQPSEFTFSQWELTYPVGFFKDLCLSAISKLGTYFETNRIDPLSFFTYGSYWLSELN